MKLSPYIGYGLSSLMGAAFATSVLVFGTTRLEGPAGPRGFEGPVGPAGIAGANLTLPTGFGFLWSGANCPSPSSYQGTFVFVPEYPSRVTSEASFAVCATR